MRGVVLLVVALLALPALADDGPPDAERRFDEATKLAQSGRFGEAAAAYREVADWKTGDDFPRRAQALYCAALQLDSAKRYDEALAAFREVVARWPESRYAKLAQAEAEKLDPPGARGLDFKRRLTAVWDVLLPPHGAPPPGPAELARAQDLLEKLLADHRDHPQACDVALALGDVRARRGDRDGARAAHQEAVQLARREAEKPGAGAVARGNLENAETRLAESVRVVRRRTIDRLAKAVLLAVAVVFVAARPWRASARRVLRLGAKLAAADVVLALAAVALAEYVRRVIDDHSPLEDRQAAFLVLGPGLAAILTALGIANVSAGRRGRLIAALAGMLAGAAVAAILVNVFGLFPFLDSEL